jgi:hypothetical protein
MSQANRTTNNVEPFFHPVSHYGSPDESCVASDEPQRFIDKHASTRRHRSIQASRTPSHSRLDPRGKCEAISVSTTTKCISGSFPRGELRSSMGASYSGNAESISIIDGAAGSAKKHHPVLDRSGESPRPPTLAGRRAQPILKRGRTASTCGPPEVSVLRLVILPLPTSGGLSRSRLE